jgi:hypothetical protein
MRGGCSYSSRGDSKRGFVEDFESLLDCDSSNTVIFKKRLDALSLEACTTVRVEE